MSASTAFGTCSPVMYIADLGELRTVPEYFARNRVERVTWCGSAVVVGERIYSQTLILRLQVRGIAVVEVRTPDGCHGIVAHWSRSLRRQVESVGTRESVLVLSLE